VVYIRSNLCWALRFLRDPANVRVLWADALCINQDDLEERNQQVSLMGFIFGRAQTVLVWLGTSTGHYDIQEGASPAGYYSLLCNRPYWNRVWIVQEIGLAKQIICCYEWRGASVTEDWSHFIEKLKEHLTEEEAKLPLKLHRQREGRHGDDNQL
jgi:hypothetical protein